MADSEHHETEHRHGEMDITTQEQTFMGFVRFSTWTTVGVVLLLIFLGLLTL